MPTGNAIQSATGTVQSVTAADQSIVISGPAAAPTVSVGNIGWLPSDYGLLDWAFDPGLANGGVVMIAGTVYLIRVNVRSPITATNIWFSVTSAGSGTSTGSFAGIYNSSGTLLSGSADMAASLTGAGAKSVALTTPQALGVGFYWVTLLVNLSVTQPTLARSNIPATSLVTLNLSAGQFRSAVNGTVQTALPAPITPSSNTTAGSIFFWVGIN